MEEELSEMKHQFIKQQAIEKVVTQKRKESENKIFGADTLENIRMQRALRGRDEKEQVTVLVFENGRPVKRQDPFTLGNSVGSRFSLRPS